MELRNMIMGAMKEALNESRVLSPAKDNHIDIPMIMEVMKEALNENRISSPPKDNHVEMPTVCPLCRSTSVPNIPNVQNFHDPVRRPMGFSKKILIFVSIMFGSTWGVNMFSFISPDLDYSSVLMGLSTVLMGSSIGFYEINEFKKCKYLGKNTLNNQGGNTNAQNLH